MKHSPLPPFLDASEVHLVVVATDPVWVGAVKQTLRRNRSPAEPLPPVHCVEALEEVPSPSGRQFCLVQVGHLSLAATAKWLLSRRTTGSLWRAAVLFDRLGEGRIAEPERSAAFSLLHEAGASFAVRSLWELPSVLDRGLRWLGELPPGTSDPLAELPLPIAGVGWQARSVRV